MIFGYDNAGPAVKVTRWFNVAKDGLPVNPGTYQWDGFPDGKVRFGEVTGNRELIVEGGDSLNWICPTDMWRGTVKE